MIISFDLRIFPWTVSSSPSSGLTRQSVCICFSTAFSGNKRNRARLSNYRVRSEFALVPKHSASYKFHYRFLFCFFFDTNRLLRRKFNEPINSKMILSQPIVGECDANRSPLTAESSEGARYYRALSRGGCYSIDPPPSSTSSSSSPRWLACSPAPLAVLVASPATIMSSCTSDFSPLATTISPTRLSREGRSSL